MSDRVRQLYTKYWNDPLAIEAQRRAEEIRRREMRCTQLTEIWLHRLAKAFREGSLEARYYSDTVAYTEADFECASTRIASMDGISVNIGPWTKGEANDSLTCRKVELKYKPD